MNYRQIVNLYRKKRFDLLDKLAIAFAHFNTTVCFDNYHVFFNYSALNIEFIIKAKNDFELQAYKYFAQLVSSMTDHLKELEHELQKAC